MFASPTLQPTYPGQLHSVEHSGQRQQESWRVSAGQWDPWDPRWMRGSANADVQLLPPVGPQCQLSYHYLCELRAQVRGPIESPHVHLPCYSFCPSLWSVTIEPISQTNCAITTKVPG